LAVSAEADSSVTNPAKL